MQTPQHLIIVMIRWTGLAPLEFEFRFPGSLTSTFRAGRWPEAVFADPGTGRLYREPLAQVPFEFRKQGGQGSRVEGCGVWGVGCGSRVEG